MYILILKEKTASDSSSLIRLLSMIYSLFTQVQDTVYRRVSKLETTMESQSQLVNTTQLNERILQLETKVAELQASSASTYNGSFIWRIPDIRRRRRDAINGKITSIYSPPFYTERNRYKMCIRAYLNGDRIGYNTHVSIFFVLMKGML